MNRFIGLVLFFLLAGCSATQPKNANNVCAIFEEKPDWYEYADDAREKWGAPIHVTMSIMYQESSFKADARPPKDYLLGFIPWGYVSTAYGYSQAKTATWEDYVRETNNWGADRDDFADAIDFMAWFIYKSNRVNRVSKWDGYNQYLNYHEGWGGFKRKSYTRKPWLMKVAKKVDSRAKRFAGQLKSCQADLGKGWFWHLFH